MREIIYLLLFTALLLPVMGKNYPVMLKIKSTATLKTGVKVSFRAGVEEVLTQNQYSLISETAQETALREQALQMKRACYDDNCLIKTGKMLAAKGLFVADLTPMGKDYLFKIRLIDFETGETRASVSEFYPGEDLNNHRKLHTFARGMTRRALNHRKPGNKEMEKVVLKKSLPVVKTEPLKVVDPLVEAGCVRETPERCYQEGMKKQNQQRYREANNFFRRGCHYQHSTSCSLLGVNTFYGKGVWVNVEQGMKLFQKGCRLNNYDACYNLGYTYEQSSESGAIEKQFGDERGFQQGKIDAKNAVLCDFSPGKSPFGMVILWGMLGILLFVFRGGKNGPKIVDT